MGIEATGFLKRRVADIGAAVLTMPNGQTWRRCLLVYAGFLACALPLGLGAGFLRPAIAPLPPASFAVLSLSLLLRPALLEELLFRAALLPRDTNRWSTRNLVVVSLLALVLFVAAHPLHGWLTRPAALGLFTDPAFLACAALLGAACTLTYLISRSLWPPVLFHWVSVLIWITLLGGHGLISSAVQATSSN